MGDEADAMYDRALFDEYGDLIEIQDMIDDNAREGFWETQDGKCIAFEDILPSHRRNIISWCKRNELIPPLDIEE